VTPEQAHTVLAEFAKARQNIGEAVRVLAAAGVAQTVIARESGLSREGVRKILARPVETAVCNACGWEQRNPKIPENTCPHCGQPDVNYFTQPG
jgi:predicted Zn-ribbon and HTH transcriptional regulator